MIEIYVNNIKRSLKDKCYFSALALALALPDMCGMVEFPEEQSVSKRYIEWFDKYLEPSFKNERGEDGDGSPWLSGEVVYNLRNTYLHQGLPSINSGKIKEETNQIDKFTLMLGDGTLIQQMTSCIDFNNGEVVVRNIIIDITYLCENLCDCALWYYQNNSEKFSFNFSIIVQDELKNSKPLDFSEDVLAKVINKKLSDTGSTRRVVENPEFTKNIYNGAVESIKYIFSNEETKRRFLSGESEIVFVQPTLEEAKATAKVPVKMDKREAQVRSYFGRHFKKKMYVDKKEEIIHSVLEAKTKQQVNNNLMKFFKSEDVKDIYQRLQPLMKNMPGK